MAEQEKKVVSQENEGDKNFDQELNTIETSLARIDKLRKQQFAVAVGGIILILLVLTFFFSSLMAFFQGYNTQLLLKELYANSSIISQSDELAEVQNNFKEIFLPAYKREVGAALQEAMPDIKKKMLESAQDLGIFVKTDIRQRLTQRLTKAMKKIEANVVKSHPNISSVELHKALQEANTHFINEVTAILDKRLKLAQQKLALLDQSFKQYKSTPEYAELRGMDNDKVENKLVETFLELWIYHLDPQKGNLPAEGVK